MTTGFQVTFDAHEPERLARFWADVLGYVEQPPPPGFASADEFLQSLGFGPGGAGPLRRRLSYGRLTLPGSRGPAPTAADHSVADCRTAV